MKFNLTLLLALWIRRRATAFTTVPRSSTIASDLSAIIAPCTLGGCQTRRYNASKSHGLAALPTATEVSADDFMKQLGHASRIIPLLHPEGDDELTEEEHASLLPILSSQFSHSDGVRGFFAVYLTSSESLAAEEVPPVLAEAVRGADAKVMVPLACMNVIMPTAMSSIHQDEELVECAVKTASNGKKILRLLKGSDDVINNCNAILSVCRGAEEEAEVESGELIGYWEKFFVNYKYEQQQKNDIALAVSEFCD